MTAEPCPRCGRRIETAGEKVCNDCEVGAILGYENLRLSGVPRDEALRIAFPEDYEDEGGDC